MSNILIKCLFLVVWFVLLDCRDYQNRPKISTLNGHLILEPAQDKSIYLRVNGPKSGIFAQDMNLLHISLSENPEKYPVIENFDKYNNGPNSIMGRIQRLENSMSESPQNFIQNITLLMRRVNRLNNRISNLERQLGNSLRDECQSNPCQNGGTCLNLARGYYCLCPSNWEGHNCEIDVNECRNFAGTDLGCQNGATCINRPGSYECLCSSGWLGLHCTKRQKDCSSGSFEMCGYGTCIPVTSGEGIKCICNQGWETNGTSVACLTDVNECDTSRGPRCSTNPKVDCINLPGSFRCGQCPPGYEGDGFTCHDIDECITVPNGGCSLLVTCHNTIGSRICGPCPPGYQGDGVTCTWRGSCNINRGGCHPSSQCIESMGVVQCICPLGMDGDGFGLHGCYVSTTGNSTTRCENIPCGTHGQCHPLLNGYTCLCHKGFSGIHCETPVDYCSSNPCQNGGSCRVDDSPAGFRCECTAQYSGQLCQLKMKSCSGVLDAEVGSLIYPLTNSSYEHNSKCAWVIHTAPNKVINVTFSRFDLELEPECMYDFLQIHDGRTSSSQLIGRFCGNDLPKGGNIISSHNNLYLWFRSDKTVSKDGFALHWNSINPVCGGEVDATSYGHINSPGSPGKYPPNRDCFWQLTTSLGKRISLHFFALDIETHPNCSFDFLAIYDGEHATDPLINKYCNSTQPPPIQSASSNILIHFHSDAYGSGNGFQITYAPVEGIPGCGGYYSLDKGEIVSPSYNGVYLNNLMCEYKISTNPGDKIRLDFKSFKLERSIRCRYDYLKVYDGPSSDSKLVGKFCGSLHPQSYTSSSNNLFIIFKTDHSSASEGFKIAFETVCQKTIFGDSGVVTSPGYPFSYPENKVCEYIIAINPGKSIQLTFQDFDIEDNRYYSCMYDNIEVRDGPDRNASLLGKFCGGSEHIPPVQTSTHNFMYLRFNSDMSISGTGFYANYTTIDTECGGIYRETTGLISHPSSDGDATKTYKDNQECIWILIAPPSMLIKISWNRFNIEKMPDCDSDYVELVEIEGNNKNDSLGKFCGSSFPPALTTTTNRLMIIFKSDYSIRSSGFSLSYTFLDARTHCGAAYVKSHGFLYSPGWPKRYEPDRDCIWTISVPAGQQIMLNISQFDLERPIRDKCDLGDYLEIRNGANSNSPLIGKYCGSFTSKRIISASNKVYLRFHSDFYLTGNGFKVEWDGTIIGCGGTLTSSSGIITSPNYPESYYENAECFYKIVTSHGSRIRIRFTEIELERTQSCSDDYVEIFDGRDENSNSLGRYCYPKSTLDSIETTSNIAFIKFRTDAYLVAKGFLLNYDTVCESNITGRYGIIESPGYPSNYQLNINCLWTINVPKGNKINVTFSHFDIYKPYITSVLRFRYDIRQGAPLRMRSNCTSDYLQWKETNGLQFSDKYCGWSAPIIRSTFSNSLQIKFITGSFLPRSGFRLEWVSYGCGGHLKKRYGIVTLNKNVVSNGELECQWTIESPLGTSLSISFDSLYMTESHNCSIDSIEIFNGQSAESPLLSKFCHRSNTFIQSTTNYALVRFIKRSNFKDVSFSFNFHSWKSGCGGQLIALSGTVYSKNYPKNYDNNINCLWTIIVPKNHRIEINILDLDFYSYSSNDDNKDSCGDYLKVYQKDITSNYSKIICPGSKIKQIFSQTNTVSLQFVTDGQGTAKGFKLNYTMTCGAIINASHDGIIMNDKFLSHSNKSCLWIIKAPRLDQKITVTITFMSIRKAFDVVSNKSCSSSFLRIHDGIDEFAPIVDEYCGQKVPPPIISHGNTLTLELGTYSNKIEGQFSAHYSSFDNACGGTLTSQEGIIASPLYPQPYPINTDCEWILATSPGNKVYITFNAFSLQYSEGCNQDYLEVRQNDSAGPLLGVYCGNEIPTNTTSASKLYLKFHSDNKDSSVGFMINYGFLHGNDIRGLDRGEIASPLYPFMYEGFADFSWRVTVSSGKISLNVAKLEIFSPGEQCSNYLAIYDGFDEDASLIENLCGIVNYNEKIIQTTSNVVYMKLKLDDTNTGSKFLIKWRKAERAEIDNSDNAINCGSNLTQLVEPGNSITFSSPGYPSNYNNNMNCEWVFKTTPGHHLTIRFNSFRLEETSHCFADHISIFSADVFGQWKSIKDKACLLDEVSHVFNSSAYLKMTLKTDVSITAKGFEAQVVSECGGTLSNASGLVSISWLEWQSSTSYIIECNWNIKVKPGRSIKLQFLHFNITNTDSCTTFITLRNGESLESPLLGSGKYCGYDHEDKNEIITSSNALSVSYTASNIHSGIFKNFKLWYEEKSEECGGTAILSSDHSWEIITSPNYPSIPAPYTECVWRITGAPGEILRVDFDRIDLDKVTDCQSEYIEIHDGLSELSPVKERLCGTENPGSIKTSSNTLYIKYSTQKLTPNNGFKANISIDVCGGTIIANAGELTSPGYPHMPMLKYGSVCEWRIKGNPLFTFSFQARDIHLPDSEAPCETKITIEESVPEKNTLPILMKYCSDDIFQESNELVTTLTNDVTIKLHIGKPSDYLQLTQYRGFRFTFNSSIPKCGGTINTPEGYISTPGYPRDTTLRSCYWKISVPDHTRRVTLQFIDADIERHRISIYNDPSYRTLIQNIPSDNYSPTTQTFESTGNTLVVFVWLEPRFGSHHRFKAKFDSDKPALCGDRLSGTSGQFSSPTLDRAYTCKWTYNFDPTTVDNLLNTTDMLKNTLLLKVHLNSSVNNAFCRYSDPKLNIKSIISARGIRYNRDICSTKESEFRIPSTSVDFLATKPKTSSVSFNVEWKIQPCGGLVHISENPINILNIPNDYNDSIDCAWLILIPTSRRVELKLDGLFQLGCDDEFIRIDPGVSSSTIPIGIFCKDRTLESPILLKYSSPFIQYHSKAKKVTNIQLIMKTVQNQCGGYLLTYESVFESPNYPKNYNENQECTWEIKTELGNRISLKFMGRFAIETRPNCTKDALIIYDWVDNSYIQMDRLCGRTPPPPFNSTNNKMKVVLRTDNEINLDGFQAVWSRICGGNYVATENEQFLYSPGYPYRYSPNLQCIYKISAKDKQLVIIKFLEFELEGPYPECNNDNLTITAESRNDYLYDTTYCGEELPPVISYEEITLDFRTDTFMSKKGFKIAYTIATCGGDIKAPTVLTSNPTEYYNHNLNCTWRIIAPSDKIIVLRFLYLDLESTYNCYNDYLAIYNGLDINADNRLGMLCGREDNSSQIITSSNNEMLLQFITDSSVDGKGFQVAISFSYSTSIGCGGFINVTDSYNLKSPLIGSSTVYENFLDCHWAFVAPVDHILLVKFKAFHIAPCENVNQTALGYNNCDCDFVEVRDGLTHSSVVINKYCGHTLPSDIMSSDNTLSFVLFTDGEITSSGFEATITVQKSICGQSNYIVNNSIQHITSPNYESGYLSRGIRCVYHLQSANSLPIHIHIKNLNIEPSTNNMTQCNKDKLILSKFAKPLNISLGKDFILNQDNEIFFENAYLFEQAVIQSIPNSYVYCGVQKSVDIFFSGSVTIILLTSPEPTTILRKGFELEAMHESFCGRNYTAAYGRVKSIDNYDDIEAFRSDCYTLITAPENKTISAYFLRTFPSYMNEAFVKIYDGDKTTSPLLKTIDSSYEVMAVFSTGRYMLLHNHGNSNYRMNYDLTFVTTDMGPGCGGFLHGEIGRITSPMYPEIYRKRSACEWELETPTETRLFLRFSVFDLGRACDQIYVQLIDRKGNTISNYCSESPADYTSIDNYVKIVFVTTMNNGGTGWVAEFVGIK